VSSKGLSCDPVLGVIEQQIVNPKREVLETLWVLGKQIAQMKVTNAIGMRLKRAPSREVRDCLHRVGALSMKNARVIQLRSPDTTGQAQLYALSYKLSFPLALQICWTCPDASKSCHA
jgi:hypothetical protein